MTTETKLPVWRTVADAYGFMFRNIKPFFALSTMPILFMTVVRLFDFIRRGESQALLMAAPERDAWHFAGLIANDFIWSVFAVSWHRYILLGRRDTTDIIQFQTGRREMKFFLYALVFAVPLDIFTIAIDSSANHPGSIFHLLISIFAIVMVFVITFIWIRCLLIYPAVAVEGDGGFVIAWKQIRGATWRLLFAITVSFVPFMIFTVILAVLYSAFYASDPAITPFLWKMDIILIIVVQIIAFLFAGVGLTILSFTFRHKSGWVTPAQRLSS